MEIQVVQGNWGDSRQEDIRVLLQNVATHFATGFRETLDWHILVSPTNTEEDEPMTCYLSSPQEPFRILLQARDKYWAKFAYQFAHELCHVASGFERLRGNPNNWFHEALCELASIVTLRRMAKSWPDNPPYSNWSDYAPSLTEYAQDCLARPERQLPTGLSLGSWLDREEESLRADKYQRDKNAIVAYALLSPFEDTPSGWNTISLLPESNDTLSIYLHDWRAKAENIDAPFVERILSILESGRLRR